MGFTAGMVITVFLLFLLWLLTDKVIKADRIDEPLEDDEKALGIG